MTVRFMISFVVMNGQRGVVFWMVREDRMVLMDLGGLLDWSNVLGLLACRGILRVGEAVLLLEHEHVRGSYYLCDYHLCERVCTCSLGGATFAPHFRHGRPYTFSPTPATVQHQACRRSSPPTPLNHRIADDTPP